MAVSTVPLLDVTGEGDGLYRVSHASLDGYEIFKGVDGSAIDFDAPPWQTIATLPVTYAAPAAGHRYEFVVRRRNAWGLTSLNVASIVLDLDAGGVEIPTPPSAPLDVSIAPAANASILVNASYAYDIDGTFQADAFIVYMRTNGTDPNPAIDSPAYEVDMVKADGVSRLELADGSFAEGADVRVIVRARRSGTPDVDSTNVDVHSTTTTFVGPAAPATGGAFPGEIAEQTQ